MLIKNEQKRISEFCSDIKSSSTNEPSGKAEDRILQFYNISAGKSIISDAKTYDKFNNSSERKHDLGKDNAYKKRHHIAWIISTQTIEEANFISVLNTFQNAGGAIFLFGDNEPWLSHANEYVKMKFGITLTGNYIGNQTLTFKENGHNQTGFFGQHYIFTGIQNLYEGR